jgi:hypothetical protein
VPHHLFPGVLLASRHQASRINLPQNNRCNCARCVVEALLCCLRATELCSKTSNHSPLCGNMEPSLPFPRRPPNPQSLKTLWQQPPHEITGRKMRLRKYASFPFEPVLESWQTRALCSASPGFSQVSTCNADFSQIYDTPLMKLAFAAVSLCYISAMLLFTNQPHRAQFIENSTTLRLFRCVLL